MAAPTIPAICNGKRCRLEKPKTNGSVKGASPFLHPPLQETITKDQKAAAIHMRAAKKSMSITRCAGGDAFNLNKKPVQDRL